MDCRWEYPSRKKTCTFPNYCFTRVVYYCSKRLRILKRLAIVSDTYRWNFRPTVRLYFLNDCSMKFICLILFCTVYCSLGFLEKIAWHSSNRNESWKWLFKAANHTQHYMLFARVTIECWYTYSGKRRYHTKLHSILSLVPSADDVIKKVDVNWHLSAKDKLLRKVT